MSVYHHKIRYYGEAKPGELNHLSTPRRRNQKEIPKVAASEIGRAQTYVACNIGVVGLRYRNIIDSRIVWEV